MAEGYVTLDEAAELEGIGYETMKKRIQRNPEKFLITKEQREKGGKELTMVAVSSLTRKARNAWREREKLKELAGAPDQEAEKPEAPWYVDMDIDWFMENHREKWYRAMELGNVVREFMGYNKKKKTEYAEDFARERIGKDARTLYRYMKSYREAEAWADRLHKEDGGNYEFFKVLCLCRKPKDVGTFPSFRPEVRQAIKNIWFNGDFAKNQGTKEMLYEKLTAIAALNRWGKIPSYQSVVRYINYLMEDENMHNAWYLSSNGLKDYRNKVMVKAERNTKDLKVMEVVMGDEHTFDCWVAYTNRNGKVTAVKPHLAVWIDIRSRMILGDVMCKDANSRVLKESLLKLLYHDAGSVPRYIYIDNGRDYTAKGMTGADRNGRRRGKGTDAGGDMYGTAFDDTVRGFYKSIGIEEYHRALPYQPWAKGEIERFFGSVCSKFTRWMKSYTGTLTGSRTDAKVDKDIQGMLERGELLSMDEFYEKWTQWLHTVYMVKPHGGLKKQGEEFTTPKGCFENAERYEKAVPPKGFATILMMESENRLVRNTGIQMEGLSYRSDELCALIGQTVDVKYDPHDMGTIYVFQKGKQVCEAYAQELLAFTCESGVEKKALEHFRMQKKQLKNDRRILEEANVPFTELNDQYVGFDETVGGIGLMTGRKKRKTAKIVSMPEDNTYRNGFRGKKQEEPAEGNAYINKKAEEALRALRAL